MEGKQRSQPTRSGSAMSRNWPSTAMPAASCDSMSSISNRPIRWSRLPGWSAYCLSSTTGYRALVITSGSLQSQNCSCCWQGLLGHATLRPLSRPQRFAQHVGDRRAAEFSPQSLLGTAVDPVQGGPDAPADWALQVWLGVVHGKQRLEFPGLVHLAPGEVLPPASHAPAPPRPAPVRHTAPPSPSART